MTLTHTQHTMLTWLERHGPAPLSHIARAFGITTDTAGVHMNIISRAGQAHATGRGCKSRWQAGPRQELRAVDGDPIVQCPSVWVYAVRVAAANRGGRISP